MNVVTGQPPLHPHACGVLPFPNINVDPQMRFVDTERQFIQGGQYERLYVSEPAVQEMGRLLGFPSKDEHTLALAKCAELEARVRELEEENSELSRDIGAVERLEHRDFVRRRKQGRPPNKPTSKAA